MPGARDTEPGPVPERRDRETIDGWLDAMTAALRDALGDHPAPLVVGIRSGGVVIARELHRRLGLETPLGELNIAFYRDDFDTIGLHPVVGPSDLPASIEDRVIVLVDDVLSTGRTVRAAMNELFDFGRPARILLAVLVERAGHELPIRADVAGARMDLPRERQIELESEPLGLRIEARR